MGGLWQRWRRPVLLILIMAVVTLSLSYTAQVRGRLITLSGLLAWAALPVETGFAAVGQHVVQAAATVRQLGQLQAENQRLRQEMADYQSVRAELAQVLAVNDQLAAALGMQRAYRGWRLVPATIVARSPDSWFDTVVIDRGSDAGVQVGMAVVVPQGVVGRVIQVTPHTATVMLLLDPNSGVGAVDVRSQAAGIVQGQDPVSGTVNFLLFAHRPDVAPGDAVVTSRFSQYFPPGLLIGRVVAVRHTQFGLTVTATVDPSVHFDQLATVMVVEYAPPGAVAPPLYGGGG
ncbi:MAG: rod shape-determining protein MreC [Firmicutes bacterium]|nr:rod shape-determining protein MreC [Alicyclobacillaceae bacterium]MCL6496985.1 rod shape-determining protein MreC [Bacillota bacterium]